MVTIITTKRNAIKRKAEQQPIVVVTIVVQEKATLAQKRKEQAKHV